MKNCKTGLLTVFMAVFVFPVMAQPKVIAHRGYWNTAGSAQNSIAALKKAAEIGVYGSEFDVHVTKDGIPIVIHDDKIGLKKIEKYNYSEFRDHKLSNGERIPTLEEYLAEGAKYPGMKLVLEIKSASTPELESEWIGIILSEVEKAGVEGQVEYIAFSLHVVKELAASRAAAPIAYLNGDISPEQLAELGIKGLDYSLRVMKSHPEWFGEARSAGISVNVWTVNKPVDMKWLISNGAGFITTDKPILLQSIIEEDNQLDTAVSVGL